MSAASGWLLAQHVIAWAISLGAAAWLIRRALSRDPAKGPCASCAAQRAMTKRPVEGSAPGVSTRTK